MSEFFLNIVNMSISASWIVLAVLLLRLLLKKAPKWITVLLWGIVAVRLICPFTIESVMSLIPSAETISPQVLIETPEINTGIPILNNTINPIIQESSVTIAPEKSINILQLLVLIFSKIWLVGVSLMLAYTVISYFRVKRKIGTAVLLRANIYQSETVISPFVLGIIKPEIYLPFNMGEQDMEHVIAHEQAHIRRKDHLWKPFGFLLLTLHWFNPLMWLGYVLLCRDIELACDEKVVKEMNTEQRADYSQVLLTCSVNRRMIAACPLAFGEVGVKNRVKSVLNYKKPAFWIIVAAIVSSIVVAVCFLTNPINTSDSVIRKLVNLEDYEVIEQDIQKITLSIPISDLTDEIFSEDGKEFAENEIIAYQNATTTIYLKEAQYSNEGKENLYFCFDFAFDLPKEQGTLLYPYEILDSGLNDSVRTADGILIADNGEFVDAVNDRGQGSYNLIWFYVSTDALKQAQGIINFDIYLNQITYYSDWDDYSSVSNISGADAPQNVVVGRRLTLNDIKSLSKKGDKLKWEDFEDFSYVVTGSGLYIRHYKIDEMFSLLIGGTNPDEDAWYFHLHASDAWNEQIDIRTSDVEAFINEHKNNPVVKNVSWGYHSCPVDNTGDNFNKMIEIGGMPPNAYVSSIQSLATVKITSVSELQSFISKMESAMNFNQSYSDAASFNDVSKEYTDEYFENTTLFLIYTSAGTSANRFSLDYATKSLGVLSIGIMESVPESGDTVMQGWLICVSIPNDNIKDIDTVDARISSTNYPDSGTANAEAVRIYSFRDSEDETIKPSFTLFDNGKFTFTFSGISSYVGVGDYDLEKGRLTLKTDDGQYVYCFDKIDDTMVFDAEASSKMLWFSDMYDGCVFK